MSRELALLAEEAGLDLSAPDEVRRRAKQSPPVHDDWREELESYTGRPLLVAAVDTGDQ